MISEAEAQKASTHKRALRALELWVVSGGVLAQAAVATADAEASDEDTKKLKALTDAMAAVSGAIKDL